MSLDQSYIDDIRDELAELTPEEKEMLADIFRDTPKEVVKETKGIISQRDKLFESGSSFLPVKRSQIAGIDNILNQIDNVIHALSNYGEYNKFGARLEPGILFEGVPGTGKTMVSRYIATESDALFIDIRDFPYNGSTLNANDISDLFDRARAAVAKKNRPVILFWDEFEGFAKERGRGASAAQTAMVSQITAELDGVDGKMKGVLLIGCTNYADTIDRALLRPGRMGLHISFSAPDREGKKQLLGLYLDLVAHKSEIDLETMSYFFNDWDTAATIEEAVHEAWRLAVRRAIKNANSKPFVSDSELIEVFLERLIGQAPSFSHLTPELLRNIAIHEVGHALAAVIYDVPLRLLTIRPGKETLGKTITHNFDPRYGTVAEQLAQIRVGMGGLMAERITGIPRTTGASGDTKSVTTLALNLVEQDDAGTMTRIFNPHGYKGRFYDFRPSVSDRVLSDMDEDVIEILMAAEGKVKRDFEEIGAEKIFNLADHLVANETLTGKQFKEYYEMLAKTANPVL